MAWPVTDFDNVKFNQDDTGWNEVAAIHLAIKERADATGHSLADSAPYNAVFSGDVWLGDPDGDSGRVYLKDLLEDFYTAISDLIDGDANIRWTETTAKGTRWTLASLVTDVDMGAFADLLTRAQNHEPFQWLHAALDRLIFAEVSLPCTGGSYTYTNSGDVSGVPQDAWDDRAVNSSTPSSPVFPQLKWEIEFVSSGVWEAHVRKDHSGITFETGALDGVISEAYYEYTWLWDDVNISTVDADIGTTSLTGTGSTGIVYVTTSDATLASNTVIAMDFTTTEPSTCPISPTAGGGFLQLTLRGLDVYIDLATILTDQA